MVVAGCAPFSTVVDSFFIGGSIPADMGFPWRASLEVFDLVALWSCKNDFYDSSKTFSGLLPPSVYEEHRKCSGCYGMAGSEWRQLQVRSICNLSFYLSLLVLVFWMFFSVRATYIHFLFNDLFDLRRRSLALQDRRKVTANLPALPLPVSASEAH